MLEYMFNNLSLIDKYQTLYEDGIDIKKIQKNVLSGELTKGEIIAHTRFRVFLDQCLLLLNKEKMANYLNKKFSFRDYLVEKNNNEIVNCIKSIVSRDKFALNVNINEVALFYSLDGKKLNPWEQGNIIRCAAAHAQYSSFVTTEEGLIYYFYVDNIDEKKDIRGIVIEEIFHDWVKTFFSNYTTFGIPYKHTCITYFSFLDEKCTGTPLWVTFKISDSFDQKYSGNSHPMRELGFKFKEPEELIKYVADNKTLFKIDEIPVSTLLDENQIRAMQIKYGLSGYDETALGIKAILDFETELSNFLVHLSLLNDVVIQILYSDKCHSKSKNQKTRKEMALQLKELSEDENAVLAFRLGFLVLKAMNLAFRMEKNKPELEKYGKNTPGIDLDNLKYPALDCSKVDISDFSFNDEDVEDFCKKENITLNKDKYFVLKKLRNALMHGNVHFEMDYHKGVIFVFDDKYYDRSNTIKIDAEAFAKFLEQEVLYKHISDLGIRYPLMD